MKEQGYEQLTLFPEDSPVNRSLLPGGDRARMMTVSSGLRCSALYENSGPLGSLVRMCLVSSIWHSTKCYLTWREKVTPRNRLLFRLVASMPHTGETECALWPTPVHGHVTGGTGAMEIMKRFLLKGKITQEEYRSFVAGNGGKTNPELLEWLMGYQRAFTQLIPTPVASDAKGTSTKRFLGGGVLQSELERSVGNHSAWDNWPDESAICRVLDGVPNRVDRIRSLGNAVVPQQFYIFFKLIADLTDDKKEVESDV